MDQDRDRNGEFGNKRYSDDGVRLPTPDLPYLALLREPLNSVESAFLDAFREDPTEELIQHWRNELQNVDTLESTDPLRLLAPGYRAQLKAFINEVSRRRLRHETRIDLDGWVPGSDAYTDDEILMELERAAGDQVDLSGYEPNEYGDDDEVVARFILAHRALTDGFPQRHHGDPMDLPKPGESRVDMDDWVPGDDADVDDRVVQELSAAVGSRIDLDSYTPGDDVDADDLVAVFLIAHRTLAEHFPRE